MTDTPSSDVDAPECRRELIEMKEKAHLTRDALERNEDGRIVDEEGLDEMRAMEERHAERLAELMDELGGWPDREAVGSEGSNAAHFVALHADHDVPFQEHCLELMEEAVEADRADAESYAYLADRVRINRDDDQLYGTHLAVEEGAVTPFPIEDRDRLDERREEMGLEPFEDYVETFQEKMGLGE
jgi:hypothetical protein